MRRRRDQPFSSSPGRQPRQRLWRDGYAYIWQTGSTCVRNIAMNSAGSSIFPCTNGTKERVAWPFRTIRFPCRRVAWLRWRQQPPLEIKAYQYDIVCNGLELSSGAIRNHRPDIMYKAFELAGHSQREVDRKFGGMIRALRYGAPPHGRHRPRHRPPSSCCWQTNRTSGRS